MASSLTDNSYQGVYIGDPAEEALKKLESYRVYKDEFTDELGCYYLSPVDYQPGAHYMIMEGKVVRIDVDDEASQINTDKGLGIGSTKQEVLSAYKNVKISPHPYASPEGDYLEIKLDNGNGIIFETYQDVVTRFRLGSYPAVKYIEGCS